MEVNLALGMRTKWRRWRVLSTKAMLKSGVMRSIIDAIVPGGCDYKDTNAHLLCFLFAGFCGYLGRFEGEGGELAGGGGHG
jgi:hypothetical protein